MAEARPEGESAQQAGRDAPAVILVAPQLGENIGMAARAMLNFGLDEMRLVRPRDAWPNAAAEAAAAGAERILERARHFESTAEAVADLGYVLAATGRVRGMTNRVLTPRRAGRKLRECASASVRGGVLFGPEASGLANDDVALSDAVVQVPANPVFHSLNLAQAVLVVAYEWFAAGDAGPEDAVTHPRTRPANKAELMGLFEHLEHALDASGFLSIEGKRPIMVRNLRNLFQRAGLSEQEVRTLRGVIATLVHARPPEC
jgi:tRNA/rRNA methyltransferase